MIAKKQDKNQRNMFCAHLVDFINPDHALVKLAGEIDWDILEQEFEGLYSQVGRPAKPIRMMTGLLILKQVENLSDERVVEAYTQNPYYQYFCGESVFRWEFPCDPTELVKFRNRIGKEGFEVIFSQSVKLHCDKVNVKEVCIDTTAHEKNITYPTDAKLRNKVIEKLWKIAEEEHIHLRQSYRRKVKEQMLKLRFAHHPRRRKEALKAGRKLRTYTGRLIRDVRRKLPGERLSIYAADLEIFEQVNNQKRLDKNKIYSLHEPGVCCIAKGKNHKKFEFGSKTAFATTTNNIIVGVVNFQGNPHDSKTLYKTLEQIGHVTGQQVKTAIVDRGFRGPKQINQTQIVTPDKNPKGNTAWQKRKQRKRFRRRAAIEPIISHVKYDYRMARNYLKGTIGDDINALMAAAAFNFSKWMKEIEKKLIFWLQIIHRQVTYQIFIPIHSS